MNSIHTPVSIACMYLVWSECTETRSVPLSRIA
jgi:hypothetical protein